MLFMMAPTIAVTIPRCAAANQLTNNGSDVYTARRLAAAPDLLRKVADQPRQGVVENVPRADIMSYKLGPNV
jgi:hypothetical protein